jgi:ribosome-binding protein aMBF1 (putative translation factor)
MNKVKPNKVKPSANLLRLMKEPERVAKRGKPPKGLLSSTTPAKLEKTVRQAIIAHTVGEMLAKAREERNLSARELAIKVEASHPRVLAVEKTDSRIEVQTLVRYAEAMNYNVQLTLIPKEEGKEIVGRLS